MDRRCVPGAMPRVPSAVHAFAHCKAHEVAADTPEEARRWIVGVCPLQGRACLPQCLMVGASPLQDARAHCQVREPAANLPEQAGLTEQGHVPAAAHPCPQQLASISTLSVRAHACDLPLPER